MAEVLVNELPNCGLPSMGCQILPSYAAGLALRNIAETRLVERAKFWRDPYQALRHGHYSALTMKLERWLGWLQICLYFPSFFLCPIDPRFASSFSNLFLSDYQISSKNQSIHTMHMTISLCILLYEMVSFSSSQVAPPPQQFIHQIVRDHYSIQSA